MKNAKKSNKETELQLLRFVCFRKNHDVLRFYKFDQNERNQTIFDGFLN